MEGLIRAGLLRRRASEVAMFLASTSGLSNCKVEWLLKRFGFIRYKRAPYGKALVIKYIDYMDFKGLEFEDALRSLVDRVPFPPTNMKNELIQSFVKKYYLDNPTTFPHQSDWSRFSLLVFRDVERLFEKCRELCYPPKI